MFTIEIGFSDNETRKKVSKVYTDQATAESMAFYLLGGQTPRGVVSTAVVVGETGEIVAEFEY